MMIRLLNENDKLEDIANIYVACWKTSYKNIIDENYLQKLTFEKWIPYLKEPIHTIYIAIENGKYVGIISFDNVSVKSKKAEIYSLYVLPLYQGKGIGKQLLKQAIILLKENNCSNVSVHVIDKNYLARRFYEKENFILKSNTITNTIGKQNVVLLEYELKL